MEVWSNSVPSDLFSAEECVVAYPRCDVIPDAVSDSAVSDSALPGSVGAESGIPESVAAGGAAPDIRTAERRHLRLVAPASSVRAGARSERVSTLLAELANCSDPAERHRIQSEVAEATLPVARSIASRYRGRGVDIGDLEQIAALGLVKAARRWKPGLSDDFLQYAVPTISGEIKRYFRDCWWTVRPPRRLQEARAAVAQAEQDLRQRSGREPADQELAVELDIDLRTVRQAKAVRQCSRPSSLEDPASDNGLIDQALAGEDQDLQRAENRIAVQTLLRTLSDRDREVVDLRYFRGWSQARIGEHIGVSQMQVSRILRGICAKLRERWEN